MDMNVPESIIKVVQKSLLKELEKVEKGIEYMIGSLEKNGFVSPIDIDIALGNLKNEEVRDQAVFLESYFTSTEGVTGEPNEDISRD